MPLVAHPVRSLWGSQPRCARCVCEWLHRKWDGAPRGTFLTSKEIRCLAILPCLIQESSRLLVLASKRPHSPLIKPNEADVLSIQTSDENSYYSAEFYQNQGQRVRRNIAIRF